MGHVFTTHYCMFGLLGYSIIGIAVGDAIIDATEERTFNQVKTSMSCCKLYLR